MEFSRPAVSGAASLCDLKQDCPLGGKRDMGSLASLFSEGHCLDDSVFSGRGQVGEGWLYKVGDTHATGGQTAGASSGFL